MQEYSIIIIGGGISGLYLANKLKLKGEDIHLFERKPRLGGRIKSITQHNITYDSGALRISKYHKKVLTLIKQLHLENQLSNFNPKINYYINNKFSKHNKEYLKIFNKLKYLNNNTKFNYSFMGLAQLYFPNSLIETSIAKIGYYTDAEYLNGYQYLAESIRMHPNQETLLQMMDTAGFENTDYHNMTGGIVALHRGVKP